MEWEIAQQKSGLQKAYLEGWVNKILSALSGYCNDLLTLAVLSLAISFHLDFESL